MKKLVVANFKMNPSTIKEAKKLSESAKKTARRYKKVDVVLCPSCVHLPVLALKKQKTIAFGAQNVSFEKEGAFTGEVSAEMVKDSGASFVIVGHSERRAMGESTADMLKKIEVILKQKMTPIICIGEKSRDNEGVFLDELEGEIKEVVCGLPQAAVKRCVIAYEPLWAIGKKEAITGRKLYEIVLFIRKVLSDLYNRQTAFRVPVLYGGSVTEENAEQIFVEGEVQGFLVGRASVDAKKFGDIIRIVNEV